MTANEKIKDVFSFLHDGTISAWGGDKNLLKLVVDCEYLAEQIEESFTKFHLDLINVDKLELQAWMNLVKQTTIVKTDFIDIFEAELEIISAEIKDEIIVISCNQHDINYDYSGGFLNISCKEIKVFDQNRNELTIDQLRKICKNYWEQQRTE